MQARQAFFQSKHCLAQRRGGAVGVAVRVVAAACIAFSCAGAPSVALAQTPAFATEVDHLALGRKALDEGEPNAALQHFEAVLAEQPEERQAVLGRGQALDQLGRIDEALAIYDALLRADPSDRSALYYRGVARYHVGELEKAEADLAAAIVAGLDLAVAYQRIGDARYARGDLEGALEFYLVGLNAKDPAPSLHRAIGNAYYGLEDYASAERAYSEALRRNPDDGYASYYRGWTREKLRRPLDALADYDHAVLLAGHREARILIDRARLLFRNGAAAAALEDYLAALELEPENPAALYGAALAQLAQGQSVDAEDHLDILVAIVGENRRLGSTALFQRGRARFANENLEGALADFDVAISLAPSPGSADAHYNRALVRARMGDAAGALDDLQKAAELRPNDAEIHYALSRAAIVAGMTDLAMRSATHAERMRGRDPSGALARVVTLISLDRQQDALRDLDKYLARAPRDADAIRLAAIALLRSERHSDALALAQRFGARSPRNPNGPLLEAEAYLGLSDPESAQRALNRANQLGAPVEKITRLAGGMWVVTARMQGTGRGASFVGVDGALEQAEGALDQAVEHSSNAPETLADRARVRIMRGSYEAARADLDRAVALKPQDPKLRLARADVLKKLGACSDAIRDYDAVLSIEPENHEARSRRADCKFDEGEYFGAFGDYVASWF